MKVPVPVYSRKKSEWKPPIWINNGASMLEDEISRTNKISYTKSIHIAFVINPNWIQGKWEGSYRDHCTSMHMHDCSMQRKEFTKCRQARPDFAALSPADRCGWVEDLH